MKWDNLKNYRCPKCGGPMQPSHQDYHACKVPQCFVIHEDKLRGITSSIGKTSSKHYREVTEDENLTELNNL